MTQPIWRILISLVELDKQVSSLEKDLQKYENLIKENQEKLVELQKILEENQKNLQEKRKEADLVELKLKEIDAQESKKKKTSDSIKNQKAYKALQKEFSTLDMERKDQEELLVSAWNAIDSIEKKLQKGKDSFEEQDKKVEEKILELKKETSTILGKKKELLKTRSETANQLSEEWLAKYEKMRKQVQNPIVNILNSSCSACYYMILPQDLVKIKKGELLLCRNCYRLLYYSKEKEEEVKKTVF